MASTVTPTSTPLAKWIDAAAAKQSVPGGGSVAAVVGALAASMGEMTLQYTAGKKSAAGHEERVQQVLEELGRARGMLLRLAEEDQQAFASLQAARTDDEKRAASAACLAVPQAIVATGQRVLDLSASVADVANRWLLSDLAVSGELAMATIRCGIYNVKVNLADLEPNAAATIRGECDTATRRGVETLVKLLETIARRST